MRNMRAGFTLVEILIVVIILGILAAIVIPQFANASSSAKASSVRSTLQSIRSQIELYKIQHNDTPPTITQMWTALTGPTDSTGNTSTTNGGVFVNGPYLQQLPKNPLNNNNTAVETVAAASTADGWYYTVNAGTYTFLARDGAGATITTY